MGISLVKANIQWEDSKYGIKSSNCEESTMQEMGSAFEIETNNLKQLCVCVWVCVCECVGMLYQNHGKCKPKNYNRYTQEKKRKSDRNTLKMVTKPQEKRKNDEEKEKTIKNMLIRMYILIITLKINWLNAPTKRHELAEWIEKQDPYIHHLQETYFKLRDTYRLKVRVWKKIFYAS